jgi:hypothetical protein
MKIQATALVLVLSAIVVFGQDAAQETPVRGGRAGRGGRGGGAARRELKRVAGPELGYVAVENPLHLPPNMTLASVADVAVNSKGHVFVFHRAPTPLLEFDGNGAFIRGFGEELTSRPHGVRIDSADNLWMTDVDNHVVIKQKIVPTEHFVSGLAIGPDGLLYACTGYEGQIVKEDWNAHILGVTGQPGTGLNQYGEAHHLSFGPKRELYVADTNGSNVQKYVERAR